MATNGTTTGEYGPSWWDCERLVEDIQTRHDVQVVVQSIAVLERGRGVTSWVLYCKAMPPRQLDRPAIQTGTAQFRGNRGARTYTAGLYRALVELDEKLAQFGGQAKLPGF